MEAAPFTGPEAALTERILGVFFEVYNELGVGFVESVYARALRVALEQAGLCVVSEAMLSVSFRNVLVGQFRADLVVEQKIILELKVADQILKIHEAQLLNYLRCSEMEIGLLLNFGPMPKFRRLEFRNERKSLACVHESERIGAASNG